jgi:tetratricopeptide (TPR) repeat protein
MSPAAVAAPKRTWTKSVLFRLTAILLGLTPLLAAEALLWAVDWGRPTDHGDPYVGFSDIHPLFVHNEATGRYEVPRSRRRHFNAESFAAPKPAGEYRIFVLGESTVQGQPYDLQASFTTWLELSLGAAELARTWEVVNCGGISYASYRLVPILEEVLGHEPDLIVVCSGHNEFLEDRTYGHIKRAAGPLAWAQRQALRLRTCTLLRAGVLHLAGQSDGAAPGRTLLGPEVDARLDWEGGLAQYHRDDAWRSEVIEHYAFNLGRMTALARRAGVPLLLVAPVSNLDWPPFKSAHRPDLSDAERQECDDLCRRARACYDTDLAEAIRLLERALALDDLHADTHYQVGKCYQAAGHWDEARAALERALDVDICPLRMLQPMRERLRQVAQQAGVPLLDGHELFVQRSRHGITGPEWLVDHVHPKVEGHQLLADAIADELARQRVVRPGPDWEEQRQEAYRRHLAGLPPTYFARAEARLEGILRWAHGKVTLQRRNTATPRP